MGRVWDGLGPLLGALGRLLAVFWTFKVELFSSMSPRWALRGLSWALRGLLDRFWVDLGRDLEPFWEDLGRFEQEFGKILGLLKKYWADYGNAWHDLALLGQSLSIGPPR